MLLCPIKCGCKNSLLRLAGKSRVVKDYGLRSGNAELISNTYITGGEIVAVFGETAAIWSQDDVCEFKRVAVKQNVSGSDGGKCKFYVGGSNPENQCHLHVVPCKDADLALSMEITPSLRHLLQSRSEWKGVGQFANHTCCKRHQNVELQFITVQTMQEEDDGNALTTVKPDVAAVLRATREIQPGQFFRYQYTDQSEHVNKTLDCECCCHIGLCQPHGQKFILEKLAATHKQSFPATRTPKVGALVIVKTGGVAQPQCRVSSIKIATGILVTIKFGNIEMIVDKSWFEFDANSDSLFLQRLCFFGDMTLKRTTNSYEVWRDILNPERIMDGEALMVLLEWTIYEFSGDKKLGLPASQSKTWLADRSFCQSWDKENEPQHIPPAKCIKWVGVKEEPVWGNEVVNKLSTAVDTCFSGQTVAALWIPAVSQQSRDFQLLRADLPN